MGSRRSGGQSFQLSRSSGLRAISVLELADCARKLKIQNGRNKTQNAREKKLVNLLFIKMDMRAPCVLFAYFSAPGDEKEETGDWLLPSQSHSSFASLICEARFLQQTNLNQLDYYPLFRCLFADVSPLQYDGKFRNARELSKW